MQGRREEEDLLDFISRFLVERVITLWPGNYDKWVKGKACECSVRKSYSRCSEVVVDIKHKTIYVR
jgi:hypothetical protein